MVTFTHKIVLEIELMKKNITTLLFLFSTIFLPQLLKAQNQLDAFASIGTKGIGLGLKYKNATVYTRYYYTYYGDSWRSIKEFVHTPSLGVVFNVYKEQQISLFTGFDYRAMLWEPKYMFPGVNGINYDNKYYFAFPLGIEVKPFKSLQNLSIVAETGLELEHSHFEMKGRSWNLNLWRGIFEIRYQFGERIRLK